MFSISVLFMADDSIVELSKMEYVKFYDRKWKSYDDSDAEFKEFCAHTKKCLLC